MGACLQRQVLVLYVDVKLCIINIKLKGWIILSRTRVIINNAFWSSVFGGIVFIIGDLNDSCGCNPDRFL